MHRCRIAAHWTMASRLPRRLQLLAAFTVLAVATLTWAQAPPAVTPAPTPAPAETAARSAALALDQKIIAEAKNDPEIMANLTYLSDMIGPRLTGSAALK